MKYIFLFCLMACLPRMVAAQDSINPYNIVQKGDIILQHTDVYYKPFAPPDSTIWRGQLCNYAPLLLNPDGVSTAWPSYQPLVHAKGELHDTVLSNWQPYGIPIGQYTVWQRLFQARNKPNGSTSNIVAQDSVIISKGEDVDFRATGKIELKNGFRAKAGCRFHAYIEPKWGDSVFSDEFNDTVKFQNQWHISQGWGDNGYREGAQCVYDSNVRLVTDTDAYDGHAVDIMLRENIDTCSCYVLASQTLDSCGNLVPHDSTVTKFIFSAGMIRSCPFPDSERVDTPFASAYPHAPYGKYEIREKIPHVMHHTNNWGVGTNYGFEYDMNETYLNGDMGYIYPGFTHKLRRGPYNGHFGRIGDTVIFISSAAHWCLSNNPESLIINNFPYAVQFFPWRGMDTVYAQGYAQSEWPSSLANSTASVPFYYSIVSNCVADTLPWHVDTTSDGRWRKFYAAYHDSSGTLLHFSKWNQPTSVTLSYDHLGHQKTHNCHWDYNFNNPIDSGILYLDSALDPTDLHSFTEAYAFRATDLYSGPGYPMPPIPFNGNDTTGGYQYHTFGLELLPHEVRILVDSVVVRRLPDRLIPQGSPYYDWISKLPRTLTNILPAEIDIDNGSNDPFGTDTTGQWNGNYASLTRAERIYFEHAATVPGWPGFEVVDGEPVAHHLIDYVKVWDVPKDVIIPNFPQH